MKDLRIETIMIPVLLVSMLVLSTLTLMEVSQTKQLVTLVLSK